MAKYISRRCPRCHDYVGIVIGESLNQAKVVPVIGHCMRCSYQFRWKLVTTRKPPTLVSRGRRDT